MRADVVDIVQINNHNVRQLMRNEEATALDQADGSCEASRRTGGLIGARADTDEFNRRTTLEDDDAATLNTIQAVEDTVRAADDVIAAAEKVLGITGYAVSPVAVEPRARQATMAPDIGAGETSISAVKPSRPADESQPVDSSELEGQIREFIRGDVASARKPQAEGDSEIGAGSINALLQRVAGSTFNEIDRLIDELQGLRDLLQSEGQRVSERSSSMRS